MSMLNNYNFILMALEYIVVYKLLLNKQDQCEVCSINIWRRKIRKQEGREGGKKEEGKEERKEKKGTLVGERREKKK